MQQLHVTAGFRTVLILSFACALGCGEEDSLIDAPSTAGINEPPQVNQPAQFEVKAAVVTTDAGESDLSAANLAREEKFHMRWVYRAPAGFKQPPTILEIKDQKGIICWSNHADPTATGDNEYILEADMRAPTFPGTFTVIAHNKTGTIGEQTLTIVE